jgi:hypothetical protein
MMALVWIFGSMLSLGMISVVLALVVDENRRHVAFWRASRARAWRARRIVRYRSVIHRHR